MKKSQLTLFVQYPNTVDSGGATEYNLLTYGANCPQYVL